MVDNTSVATKSALQGCFSSASSLPLQVPSASSHNPFSGTLSNQAGSGGMKLEAVMENLQRQQAARLAVEEKLREKDIQSMAESQIHQQARAFRHYQAAMRGALAGGVTNTSHGVTLPIQEVRIVDGDSSRADSVKEGNEEGDDTEEQEIMDGDEEEDGDGLDHYQHGQSLVQGTGLAPTHLMARVQTAFAQARRAESPSAQPQSQQHEWTYEEQFKQAPTYSRIQRDDTVKLKRNPGGDRTGDTDPQTEREELLHVVLAAGQEMQEIGPGGIPAWHTTKNAGISLSGSV